MKEEVMTLLHKRNFSSRLAVLALSLFASTLWGLPRVLLAQEPTIQPTSTPSSAPTSNPTGCGDGAQTAIEACDDGNTLEGDGCRADCKGIELCGDGLLDEGEACDDGNAVSGDGCRADCKGLERCGNEQVDFRSGEECDDGNVSDNDSCTNLCQEAACGDGFHQDGVEECDDGNTRGGDGCSPRCKLVTTERVTTIALAGLSPSVPMLAGYFMLQHCDNFQICGAFENDDELFAVLVAFSVLAPSAKYIYLREWKRFTIFSSLRVFFSAGALGLCNAASFGCPVDFVLGSIATVTATLALYDVLDAPYAVKRANERLQMPKRRSVSLLPSPLLTPQGTPGLGLVLGGTF